MSEENEDSSVKNLRQSLRNTSIHDIEEEEDDEIPVTLGFVEKPEHALPADPSLSIAGGSPYWLDPINLPSGNSTICDICGDPLQFLLQRYAPLSENKSTSHRTLYVFMCLSMQCLLRDQHEQLNHENPSRSVKVLRCQLPQAPEVVKAAALCSWCRTWKGSFVCCNCKITRYCCKKHQAAHWRGGHNIECRNLAVDRKDTDSTFAASNTIWPQFEIVTEDEFEDDTISENGGYDTALASAGREDEELSESVVDSFDSDADQKSWANFLERVSRDPGQVLRHCRHARDGPRGGPLWPMSSVRPSKTDVPKCSYCGGPRCFELQILPQLLYYDFGVENDASSLDWSTIVIYTCEDSCDESSAYKQEFAWVQLPSQSTATL